MSEQALQLFAPPDPTEASGPCECGRYTRTGSGRWCRLVFHHGDWRQVSIGKSPKPCAGCGQDLTPGAPLRKPKIVIPPDDQVERIADWWQQCRPQPDLFLGEILQNAAASVQNPRCVWPEGLEAWWESTDLPRVLLSMTIELCQALRRESNLSATDLTTAVQTCEELRQQRDALALRLRRLEGAE